MPVISPRRYSSTTTGSYIPPKIGGTTGSSIGGSSGLTNGSTVLEHLKSKYSTTGSSYRSSSLNNSSLYGNSSSNSSGYSSSSSYARGTTPTFRNTYSSSSSLSGGTSSTSSSPNYRTSLYGNNDTTRFGVSNKKSNNYKYYRSGSDSRDTASPLLSSTLSSPPISLQSKTPTSSTLNRQSRISSLLQKNQTKLNQCNDNDTTKTISTETFTIRRNSLHKKPPIAGGGSSNCSSSSNNLINNNSHNKNNGIILNPSIFTPTISYATLKKRIQDDEQNEINVLLKKSSSDIVLSSKTEQNCIKKTNDDNNDELNSNNLNINNNDNINKYNDNDQDIVTNNASSSSLSTTTATTSTNPNNYIKNNKISSSSSSSLELQVATSGLDLYEKYSPAHYIPKCELSRSRSLSDAQPTATVTTSIAATTPSSVKTSVNGNDKKYKLSITSTTNSNNNNNKRNSYIDTTATIHLPAVAAAGTKNSARNKSPDNTNDNCNEITKTITIRKKPDTVIAPTTSNDDEDDDTTIINNSHNNNFNKNTDTSSSLLSTSPSKSSDLTTSQLANKNKSQSYHHPEQQMLRFNRNLSGSSGVINGSSYDPLVYGKPPLSITSSSTAALSIYSSKKSSATVSVKTNSAHFGNQNLNSRYRDKNFLKNECELARSQVTKSSIQKFHTKQLQQQPNQHKITEQIDQQHSETNNNYCDNNNSLESDKLIKKYHRFDSGDSTKLPSDLIKPLVHKTTINRPILKSSKGLIQQNIHSKFSNKISTSSVTDTIQQNNNMNCLESSPDDIKFIDSDDSERQHQQQSTPTISLKSSTLPITAKQQRLLINNTRNINGHITSNNYQNNKSNENLNTIISKSSNVNGKLDVDRSHMTASTISKTTPLQNVRNLNNFSCNNVVLSQSSSSPCSDLLEQHSNIFSCKSITRPILNSLKKSTVIVSSNPTQSTSQYQQLSNEFVVNSNTATIVTTTRTPSSQSQLSLLSSTLLSSTPISTTTKTTVSSQNVSSKESTPTNSPQLNHRILINNRHQSPKTLFFNSSINNDTNNCNTNNVCLVKNQNTTTDLRNPTTLLNGDDSNLSPLKSLTTSATTSSNFTVESTVAPAAPTTITTTNNKNALQQQQQQQSTNNVCDVDDNVRSTTIRSGLAASPTPSRYYDRDRISSRLTTTTDDDHKNNSSDSNEKSGKEGLCGLRNIGNTCFMNSVIQCLSHTRELTKFLKTQTNSRASLNTDQAILIEFAKLIREMWSPSMHSVSPLELKSAFSTKHRMYSGYNQQDAQEFLRFFLDSLHSALNTGTKGEVLKLDETLSDNKIADLTWDWYSRIENSLIRDLFVGQLKSTLKCTTCGNTSVTFDPFWDLSVPLPSSSRCKLDTCLDLFIREEVLDGDEMPTCSKCKTRRKCTKSFSIQRFPKYLVIHLKRFSETRWSKLSNLVEFPTGERELNMAPYAANRNSNNCYYSLYAISNHMGSTAGGHYVALCKHPFTKKWHEFNDNIVSDDLSESMLVSSSAYLLFYERA